MGSLKSVRHSTEQERAICIRQPGAKGVCPEAVDLWRPTLRGIKTR